MTRLTGPDGFVWVKRALLPAVSTYTTGGGDDYLLLQLPHKVLKVDDTPENRAALELDEEAHSSILDGGGEEDQ